MRYVIGYQGQTVDRAGLLAWSHMRRLDFELRRRVLALLDASIVAGRPLGIGSIYRSSEQQRDLFLSRYHQSPFGTIVWEGKRWAKKAGVAAAAPPGRSYHEGTTPNGDALAIDFTGDLAWLKANAARFALVEFSQVNNEPWHAQPVEIPRSRSGYVATIHHPVPTITIPEPIPVVPAPPKVFAPKPTLSQRGRRTQPKAEVRHLQHLCNFWGWRDALGMVLVVDGDYGPKTEQAVRAMQRALAATVDGWYGPRSAAALQRHLDAMTALAGAA